MQQNEYLTVKEISIKYDMGARNVRKIISKLTESCSEATLYKNKNGEWQVHHLLVPWPKRILDVALANKINIPYSCSGGVCSTCTATCISGGVKMDYNEVLTDDEITKGRILVCTGRPTENETTITWE